MLPRLPLLIQLWLALRATKPLCRNIPFDGVRPPPVAGGPFPYVRTQTPDVAD